MKILFDRITVMKEDGAVLNNAYLAVDGEKISYLGEKKPEGKFDRVIDGTGKMLAPGFYNCHTHSAMTLFRGYAEDLPLDRWLTEKIFPAEDRLYPHAVYAANMLAIAEMIRGGTCSVSDMYFFCDEMAKAVDETGIKANIGRSCCSFDESITAETDYRFAESVKYFKEYHNTANGRIKIDMSIHAEYSIVPESCRYISAFAKENGLALQLHLSETRKEHNACVAKRGITPTKFFEELGVLDVPVTAAHCVYLTNDDREILRRHGATAVHNPASNLKLGSGVMPLAETIAAGVNVTLGTDGPSSNNQINIWREAYLAAILQKGISGNTEMMKASDFIPLLTVNGAKAQGRDDCGKIAVGAKADLVMIDLDDIPALPVYQICDTFLYGADSTCIRMNMVDGKILYENGEFLTLDYEKVKADFKEVIRTYFD